MTRLELPSRRSIGSELAQLLDDQIAALKLTGRDTSIVDALQDKRSATLKKALNILKTKYAGDNLNLLSLAERGIHIVIPVIPRTYCDANSQVTMVRCPKTKGRTEMGNNSKDRFTPDNVAHIIRTPQRPYYIFDVEDGREMLGERPEDVIDMIKKCSGRRGLTEVETIALGTHSDVLQHRGINAIGSCFRVQPRKRSSDNAIGSCPRERERHHNLRAVFALCLDEGRPQLRGNFLDCGFPHWGFPSCQARIS
ncbi:MAG: DUF5701 family protein [bacterium]|nr:DUF5701 family protein [bacterium]